MHSAATVLAAAASSPAEQPLMQLLPYCMQPRCDEPWTEVVFEAAAEGKVTVGLEHDWMKMQASVKTHPVSAVSSWSMLQQGYKGHFWQRAFGVVVAHLQQLLALPSCISAASLL